MGRGSLGRVAVSPKGDRFLTESGSGVQVWDMQGRLVWDLDLGAETVAAFSHDGSMIAVALLNGSSLVLDDNGNPLTRFGFKEASTQVVMLEWSGDDSMIAASWLSPTSSVQRVGIWGSQNGSLLGEGRLPGWSFPVSWSHNATLLAVGVPQAGNLWIYDVRDWSVVKKITVPLAGGMSWAEDDSELAFVGTTGTETKIHVWDARSESITLEKTIDVLSLVLSRSRDGTMLAGTAPGGIRVWDAQSLEDLLLIPRAASTTTTSVSWFPDDSAIMASSSDGTVVAFQVSPRTATPLVREGVEITCITQTPLGLAYGLADGTTRYVPVEGNPVYMYIPGAGATVALDLSPNNGWVVAGYESGRIAIWTTEGHLEKSWIGHQGSVLDLGWSPGQGVQSWVATLGADGFLMIWYEDGSEISRIKLDHPLTLDWSGNGSHLATGHQDGTVTIWKCPGLEPVRSVPRTGPVTVLRWSGSSPWPDRDLIATAGDGGLGGLVVWDAWGGPYYARLGTPGEPVTELAWSPDGRMLATSTISGSITVWDAAFYEVYPSARIGGLCERLVCREGVAPTGVAWAPGSDGVTVSCRDGQLLWWDLGSRATFRMANHSSRDFGGLSWSPDGSRVAQQSGSRSIRMFDVASDRTTLISLEGMPEEGGIGSIAWSPEGTRIAIAGPESYCRIFTATGDLLVSIPHTDEVMSVAWSPDSQYVATGTRSGLVNVWDGGTGALMVSLERHNERVRYLEWSRDGELLVSLSMDGDLKMYDVRSGQTARRLLLGGTISCFAWNQDCNIIVYATFQGNELTAIDIEGRRVWGRSVEEWVHDASWSPDGSELMIVPSLGPIVMLSGVGVPLCRLTGGWTPRGAEEARWSPDSRYIAGMGGNGILYLYDADPILGLGEEYTTSLCLACLSFLVLVTLTTRT